MAGEIIYHAGNLPPAGALVANGQRVSQTTYAALYSAIGFIHGPNLGDGTFPVPDLRGEFVRGTDLGRDVDSGRVMGSHQGATAFGKYLERDASVGAKITILNGESAGDSTSDHGLTTTALSGASNTSIDSPLLEVRPRNVALLPCIVY